jgi:hypothetical protein
MMDVEEVIQAIRRIMSPSENFPKYPYFRDEVKGARSGLRFPFSGAGTTQYLKNACQFPSIHGVNFTEFTSERARAPERANMVELERQKSGPIVVPSGPAVRDRVPDQVPERRDRRTLLLPGPGSGWRSELDSQRNTINSGTRYTHERD